MPEERRSSGSPREYVWLVLPVVFLVGLAVWAGHFRREDAPPVKVESNIFRLQTPVVERLNPTGYDVSLGGDTKLYLKVSTAGDFSQINFNGWDWLEDIYVVAVKDGKRRRIDEYMGGSHHVLLRVGIDAFLNPTVGQQAYYEHNLVLRLRDVPRDAGALELCWDVVYGPTPGTITDVTTAAMIAKLRRGGRSLYASVRVPLRRDGETIKLAKVSTDPLFDIRKITVRWSKSASGTSKVKIAWDIFYRGSVAEKERLSIAGQINLRDEKGSIYSTTNWSRFASHSQGLRRRRITYEVYIDSRATSQIAKGNRQWSVRGNLSINQTWPRQFNIPIDLSDEAAPVPKNEETDLGIERREN